MASHLPADPLSLGDVLRASSPGRVRLIKSLDLLAGPWAVRWLGRRAPAGATRMPKAPRRVLIIRPGGLGDAILTLPMVRALRSRWPQAQIDVLAQRRNIEVFAWEHGRTITRLLCGDDVPWHVWRLLRSADYELVIDTEQWHHFSAAAALATRAPIRIGFDTNAARSAGYTHSVPYGLEVFEGENFLRLGEAAVGSTLRVDWAMPVLPVPEEAQAWAAGTLPVEPIVALAPVGGIRERAWSARRIEELVARLTSRRVVVCLLAIRRLHEVSRVAGWDGVLDLTGRTTLAQAAAVMQRSQVVIGPDSGLMHLACAIGAPVLALFGASVTAKWSWPRPKTKRLGRALPCSPCARFACTPRCPIGVRCLEELGVDEVARVAAELAPALA